MGTSRFETGRVASWVCTPAPCPQNAHIKQVPRGILTAVFWSSLLVSMIWFYLATRSESGLQKALNILEQYCSRWQLMINMKKVMVFGRKQLAVNFIYTRVIQGSQLETTDSYTCMGLLIKTSGTFSPAIKDLHKRALRAYYHMKSTITPHSVTSNIFVVVSAIKRSPLILSYRSY